MRGHLAAGAERTYQTLGLEGAHGAADEEGLDAHVEQTGDAADGIVGVQGGEHQVTGQSATDGDFDGFLVTHFPHHDHVRVTTQNRAQAGGKGQADFGFHRDLHHPVQLVFHRVFDGHDAAVLGVQLAQQGVERGGLAGTGGTGDEDDAIGQRDELADGRLRGGIEADLGHVERFASEQAERHRFAVHRGNGGHTNVDGVAVELQVDTAILRQPALGNVEVRHDLETRNQRVLQQAHVGRHRHLEKAAVNAVADAQIALQRLYVNVRGALAQGFTEDLVHEVHHGGFFIRLVQDVDLLGHVVAGEIFAAFQQLFEVFSAHAVALVQGFQHAMTAGDLPVHPLAQLLAHGLPGIQVEGVVGQHRHIHAAHCDGVQAVTKGQFGREFVVQAAFHGIDRTVRQEGNAEHVAQLLEERLLFHQLGIQQAVDHALALVGSLLQGFPAAQSIHAARVGGGMRENVDEARRSRKGGGWHDKGAAHCNVARTAKLRLSAPIENFAWQTRRQAVKTTRPQSDSFALSLLVAVALYAYATPRFQTFGENCRRCGPDCRISVPPPARGPLFSSFFTKYEEPYSGEHHPSRTGPMGGCRPPA